MAKRKLGKLQTEYNKELNRVRRFINRASKRGYRFEGVPGFSDRPEKITRKAINQLASLNQYNLYKYATAISDTGSIVSGTERRKEERRESARKGQETRAKNKKTRIKPADPYDIVYNNIKNLIVEYPTKGSRYLNNLLASEIRRYGRNRVLRSMMQAPEALIDLAQTIIYYEDKSDRINSALRAMADIIQGHIRNAEEEEDLSEAMEDSYENYD